LPLSNSGSLAIFTAMRRASSRGEQMRRAPAQPLLGVPVGKRLRAFDFSLTISRSRTTLHSGCGEVRRLAIGEGVMRTPVAGWLALIVALGLFVVVWATGRPPCAPFGLWHTLQMNCR
jgi:hypothetical protein